MSTMVPSVSLRDDPWQKWISDSAWKQGAKLSMASWIFQRDCLPPPSGGCKVEFAPIYHRGGGEREIKLPRHLIAREPIGLDSCCLVHRLLHQRTRRSSNCSICHRPARDWVSEWVSAHHASNLKRRVTLNNGQLPTRSAQWVQKTILCAMNKFFTRFAAWLAVIISWAPATFCLMAGQGREQGHPPHKWSAFVITPGCNCSVVALRCQSVCMSGRTDANFQPSFRADGEWEGW